MQTPLSSIILVLFGSFIGSFGAVFLKLGAEHMQGSLRRLLNNYWLATGIVLYLLSSVFYMMGVAQGELTVLYPMVSIGYIWAILWARLFFKEPFTLAKIGGLVMIIFGVALINFGNA
ncbi:MAG TPA: EamA family transporter [Bryobacteraceae bacterium]|jgi:multidrug transporter EmrE-like cation transporter|nr:EamA family transporter [Bryobacteraceae bacterium]